MKCGECNNKAVAWFRTIHLCSKCFNRFKDEARLNRIKAKPKEYGKVRTAMRILWEKS